MITNIVEYVIVEEMLDIIVCPEVEIARCYYFDTTIFIPIDLRPFRNYNPETSFSYLLFDNDKSI